MRHYSNTAGIMKNIEIKSDLANVKIGLSKAIPLGLALNEILANVVKHPFSSGDTGNILIKVVELPDQHIHILVQDSGSGFPENLDLNDPPTLGLHMVKILVEDQLEGALSLSSDGGSNSQYQISPRIKLRQCH